MRGEKKKKGQQEHRKDCKVLEYTAAKEKLGLFKITWLY
jgi:hypothetical protein